MTNEERALPAIRPLDDEEAKRAVVNINDYFDPGQYHIISPGFHLTAQNLKGMKPDIQIVDLKGRFYKIGKDQHGIDKTGLNMLSEAAGLQIRTQILKLERDYVSFKAVVTWKRDGIEETLKEAHKVYDMEVIKEKLENHYLERARADYLKSKNIPNYKEEHVYKYEVIDWNSKPPKKGMVDKGHYKELARKDYLQIKEHMVSLCETKAMNRAVRSILPIKTSYTEQECEKKFVVVRLKPDYMNMTPEQVMAIKAAGQSGVNLLTGPPSPPPPMLTGDVDRTDLTEAEFNESYDEHIPDDTPPDDEPPFDEADIDAIEASFEELPPEETAEPPSPEPAPPPAPSQSDIIKCQKCEIDITPNVAAYCQQNNMPPLCMRCQRASRQ